LFQPNLLPEAIADDSKAAPAITHAHPPSMSGLNGSLCLKKMSFKNYSEKLNETTFCLS
jgi:hypothetical protein